MTLDEYPGQIFHGTLVRTDNAINPASRTLLVEVDVDNPDGKLLPGAYVFVHFTLPGRAQSMTIPVERPAVPQRGFARWRRAQRHRGTGADHDRPRLRRPVEMLSGLGTADQVILNPSDSLVSGTAVRLTSTKLPGAA